MKVPSFSIADMMAIVVLVALDCLAIRMGSALTGEPLVFGGVLTQGALVIGLVLVSRRRRRMEKPLPFLIGFVVVGWICHLAYVAVCILYAEPLTMHLTSTLMPVVSATGFERSTWPDLISRIGIIMSYLTALQLVPALVAGVISQWWWKRTHRETMPTHD